MSTASTVATPEQVFDFYDMLPKQGVDVANKPLDTATDISAGRLPTGAVVLQAGSFKQATEAEKMVAQLALAGVRVENTACIGAGRDLVSGSHRPHRDGRGTERRTSEAERCRDCDDAGRPGQRCFPALTESS